MDDQIGKTSDSLDEREQQIERLKILISEWRELCKFHSNLSKRMSGIAGQDLIAHAGSCYLDCANGLEKEIKIMEGLPLATPSRDQK